MVILHLFNNYNDYFYLFIYYYYLFNLGMMDVVDMEGNLQGDEEHVSGWDLVYDNGYIEIDPSQCGYTTFLGGGIPESDVREK